MLSERSLIELRKAATLSHLYPSLRVVLRIDDAPVIEVGWRSTAESANGARVVHPCTFRRCLAGAWRQVKDGGSIGLQGFDRDPDIHLIPHIGGATWLSGIVRVPLAGHSLYLLPTTLGPQGCRDAAEDSTEMLSKVAALDGIGIRVDSHTETSVVHVDVIKTLDSGGGKGEVPLLDRLEQLAATLAVGELVRDFRADTHSS